MTDEKVIYEAPTPPYIVQQAQYEITWGNFNAEPIWLDIKGFSRDTFAVGYADELKRENPATDYRVVKTSGAG